MSMDTPLNASANSAGGLFSNTVFEIPQFQREYSWSDDEVQDFWSDLQNNLTADVYFLGLIILTNDEGRKHVVDGQQRLITLSLLAIALYHEAIAIDRQTLADRIGATFINSVNYATDEKEPRVRLSYQVDDQTFQHISNSGFSPSIMFGGDTVSAKIAKSYEYLRKELRKDLKLDPFKRLGYWADFITNKLYFAVFVHPDPAAAYQVYEVINTRGKELTTADLLKNYILSQTPSSQRESRYNQWQDLATLFPEDGTNNFVQFIRHVVTVEDGHVLAKDLYAFLAGRLRNQEKAPHSPENLMALFDRHKELYLQIIDPSLPGPASEKMLSIFSALNALGVIVVRPLLLAIFNTADPENGMKRVLELVVRRIVVGSLGTGNVERRLGEAAQKISRMGSSVEGLADLRDLFPSKEDFVSQIKKRSYNKSTLYFLRRSVVEQTQTPTKAGNLHFICPKQTDYWEGINEEDRSFWCSTLGNTVLSTSPRRLGDPISWHTFKTNMLPTLVDGEFVDYLADIPVWDTASVIEVGKTIAEIAADVWYS